MSINIRSGFRSDVKKQGAPTARRLIIPKVSGILSTFRP